MISGNSGQSLAIVEATIAGYYNKIRDIAPYDAKRAIQVIITQLAQEYGARQDVPEYVLAEGTRLIGQKFRHLGLNEIREAYRLWAAGEIEKIEAAEMYGGKFNVRQLGAILKAYSEHRKKALACYLSLKTDIDNKESKQRREDRQRREYEENFERYLKECTAEDWREVPIHWYETAKRRGMIQFSEGEEAAIRADAEELALMEISEEIENAKSIWQSVRLKAELANGPTSKVQTIFEKLVIFRKLIRGNEILQHDPGPDH